MTAAVLTVAEVAQALRVGIHQAYALVNSGALRSVRVGRAIRVPRAALDAFLDPTSNLAQGGGPASPAADALKAAR